MWAEPKIHLSYFCNVSVTQVYALVCSLNVFNVGQFYFLVWALNFFLLILGIFRKFGGLTRDLLVWNGLQREKEAVKK